MNEELFSISIWTQETWGPHFCIGVGLDDLKDPSPSKGIKGNEFQLQLLNLKSGVSKKFLL